MQAIAILYAISALQRFYLKDRNIKNKKNVER